MFATNLAILLRVGIIIKKKYTKQNIFSVQRNLFAANADEHNCLKACPYRLKTVNDWFYFTKKNIIKNKYAKGCLLSK